MIVAYFLILTNAKAQQMSVDTERNLIGHRTQSDRTPNAIRSDTERNLIGHRTQSDRTPNAIR